MPVNTYLDYRKRKIRARNISTVAKTDFGKLAKLYSKTLLEDVVPFWEKYSVDWDCGGYFSCLDRQGNTFDTDKFMWMQCRQIWAFSLLYNEVEKKDQWLKIAKNGVDFLKKHGTDDDGNWYFSLDRKGNPLVQPYNLYSDMDAGIGFTQYFIATGDESAREVALKSHRNVVKRKDNPKGSYSKAYPGTRPLRELGMTGAILITTLEMESLLPADVFNETINTCIDEIFNFSLNEERNLLFEYTAPDGSHPDCSEGRLIVPGHSIEAMWYVMEAAKRCGDRDLINKALDIALSTAEFGWDDEFGGFFYFLDSEGRPPVQLEWDRKLWWVHLEPLITFVMGYALTGRPEAWQWFEKIHEYTWLKFPDPQYGEWWGYLDRSGKPFLELKGGKWKGCFHLPRALYQCRQILAQLAQKNH